MHRTRKALDFDFVKYAMLIIILEEYSNSRPVLSCIYSKENCEIKKNLASSTRSERPTVNNVIGPATPTASSIATRSSSLTLSLLGIK